MPAKPQKATDAELAILRLLWQREPLTAREIREALYPKGTPSDHGTVQKLLARLEEKKLIARDRTGFAHLFRSKISQSEFVGGQLEALAEKLTEGSIAPLIMHAVESEKLSAEERRAIRKLLDRRRN